MALCSPKSITKGSLSLILWSVTLLICLCCLLAIPESLVTLPFFLSGIPLTGHTAHTMTFLVKMLLCHLSPLTIFSPQNPKEDFPPLGLVFLLFWLHIYLKVDVSLLPPLPLAYDVGSCPALHLYLYFTSLPKVTELHCLSLGLLCLPKRIFFTS